MKKMQDPKTGVKFRDVKKVFDVLPQCAPGSDLLAFMKSNCNHSLPSDSAMVLQAMLDWGYLVPTKTTEELFSEGSFYTFQVRSILSSRRLYSGLNIF